MKKLFMSTQRQPSVVVSIEKMREYAESLAQKLPTYFPDDYQQDDEYRVFFPYLKKNEKKRVLGFRFSIMYAMYSVLGKSAPMDDMRLLFRCPHDHSLMYALRQKRATENATDKKMKQEMTDLHITISLPSQHSVVWVKISATISGSPWDVSVTQESLDFADCVFEALTLYSDLAIDRRAILSKCRTHEVFLARVIFVYVFSKKYPDVTEKYLAYLLGRKSHCSISRMFSVIANHQSMRGTKNEPLETEWFFRIIGRVEQGIPL